MGDFEEKKLQKSELPKSILQEFLLKKGIQVTLGLQEESY